MRNKILAYIVLLVLGTSVARAQADTVAVRPVMSVFTVDAGSTQLADTYLTPLKYNGWHLGINYGRMQAMGFDPRWSLAWGASVNYDDAENPVRNAVMRAAEISADAGMRHLWRNLLTPKLNIGAGGSLRVRGGALYLARNGNNPVAAKGEITICADAFANWRGRIAKLPFTVFYTAKLPLAGAFFTPDYGQLYYEIWLGERHGLVKPAIWPQYFSLDNSVGVDLHLGGNSLRLAYHGDYTSTRVNGITYRNVRHSVAVGVVTEWLTLSSRRKPNNIISPF